MIVEEMIDDRIRHYSDLNVMIRQIETGNLYEDAVDIIPCPYTYEETDIPIEDGEVSEEEFAQIGRIMMGVSE